jgi:hypothetical protein
MLALAKYSRRQNVGIDKMFASTKYWCRQNIGVKKIFVSTKYPCQQNVGTCAEASPYCFGPAESAAADFSQTSLMFYFSQKVLIPPRAVAKCAVAAGRPAFMGGLSPALYRLIVPAPQMKKTSQILALTKYRRPPRFHCFSPNYSSLYLCSQASYQKLVKITITVQYQFTYS